MSAVVGRPTAPPTAPRCPVCGTAVVDADRPACPGCGLVRRAPAEPVPVPPASGGPARPWGVVAAALAVVLVVVAVVAARDDRAGLATRWRVDVGAPVAGGVAVVGDVALAATADGVVVAVEARTGAPRWRFVSGEELSAPLVAAGEVALVATVGPDDGGNVFAVDLRTGQERWRVVTEAPVRAAPVVAGDVVFLARGDVSAHDTADGAQRWRHPVAGGAGPLGVGDGVVVAGSAGGVVALDAADGQERWSASGGRPAVAPGVVDGVVVVGGSEGDLVARALDRGQERWRREGFGRLRQPVLAGRDGAVAVTDRGVVGLTVADGTTRWSTGPAGDPTLRVAVEGTLLAVRTAEGVLVVDGLDGAVVAATRSPTEEPGAPAPVLADGTVLLVGPPDHLSALTLAPS